MNSFLEQYKASTSNSPLGLVLVLLLVLELFTGGFFGLYESWVPTEQPQLTLKISEIDGPAIDSGAAMISMEEEVCMTEPGIAPEVWFLALLSMSVLLVVNFGTALVKKQTREWLPELVYVILVFVAWAVLDHCHLAVWFPIVLVKASLIIFALYLYLFEKKNDGVDRLF